MKGSANPFRLLPSTRAYIREARRTPGYSVINLLHAYLYSRWPYCYVSIGTGEHRIVRSHNAAINFLLRILCRFPADKPVVGSAGLRPGRTDIGTVEDNITFSDTYHGKVLRTQDALKLVSVNREIKLMNLESVIPFAQARNLILDKPEHILALDCPCRLSRADLCHPIDVCLIIGEPFVSFVSEHYPDRARVINRETAIEILDSEAERGHVHHAFFKQALFGRFFAICNCCSCCCGAMQARRNGIPMLAPSGFVSAVAATECSGCGTCATHCQFHAIEINGASASVNPDICMGCGVCESMCPQHAIRLQRDLNRSSPLDMDELI